VNYIIPKRVKHDEYGPGFLLGYEIFGRYPVSLVMFDNNVEGAYNEILVLTNSINPHKILGEVKVSRK